METQDQNRLHPTPRPEANLAGLAQPYQYELMQIIPALEESLGKFLGKAIRPSPAKALADFGQLPEEHQKQVVRMLSSQLEFIHEAVRNDLDAYNEGSLVRLAMNKLNLLANEDIVQKIQRGDVVEILDSDHTQVYRSYSCFALCNYSIAELVTYTWYELYERPAWVQEQLIAQGSLLFNGDAGYIDLEPKLPAYFIRELRTPEKQVFGIRDKFLAKMMSARSHLPYVLSVKRITPITDAGLNSKLAFL